MELFEACEQVRGVLSDRAFQVRLLQRLKVERQLVEADKRRLSRDWRLCQLDLVDLLDIDKGIIEREKALRTHFLEHAITKLPKPAVISSDDLEQVAVPQLGGINDESAAALFERFIAAVLMRIFQIDKGKEMDFGFWSPDGSQRDGDDDIHDFCELPNGFGLRLQVDSPSWKPRATGFLSGKCSRAALGELERQVTPLIATLIQSLKLSVTNSEFRSAHQWHKELEALLDSGDKDEQTSYDTEILVVDPPIGWLLSDYTHTLIRATMNLLFHDSPFARRIKTAIALTNFADAHENSALALSLCVTAIEALVCNGTRGKIAQFSQRIPALLQCDQNLAKTAKGPVKSLYNARSRCLHGDNLVADPSHVVAARKLSAAVLRGVIEWSVNNGESLAKDDEWTSELQRCTADPNTLTVVAGIDTKEL